MSDIDHTRDCILPSDGRAEGLVRASELFALAAERDALRAEVEDLGHRLHHVHRLWANNEHALRAEVEQAQMREACAADLAREWEQHCKRAEAEVETLRATLRWYGDTGNWKSSWDHQFRMMTQEPAYADRGDKARAALEGKHD